MKRYALWLALLLCLPVSAFAAKIVDINSADERMLAAALDGVNQEGARAIVNYRKEHGLFKSVEQLALVKGIDLSVVERNRGYIVLGNQRSKPVAGCGNRTWHCASAVARTAKVWILAGSHMGHDDPAAWM